MAPKTHVVKVLGANGTNLELYLAKSWSAAELLPVLQEAIGGYLAVVNIPFSEMIMLVDEEGKLKKKKTNIRAGALAMRHIVGSAIIVKKSIWESYNE